MKTRKFTLRAVFAATLVVAIIVSIVPKQGIPTNGMLSYTIPPIIWGAAISIGLFYSGGRGRACLVFSTIGGIVGSTAGVGFLWFICLRSFGSWGQPVSLIGFGGISGCVVGILVRLIMDGLVIRDAKAGAPRR